MIKFSNVAYDSQVVGPAKVNLDTGLLTLNPNHYGAMSSNDQKAILIHELAHLNLDTEDELAADTWAMQHTDIYDIEPIDYAYAFAKLLDPLEPGHFTRLLNMNNQLNTIPVREPHAWTPFKDIGNAVNNFIDDRHDRKMELANAQTGSEALAAIFSSSTGAPSSSTTSNTYLYLGIGVAVIVFAVVYKMKKKK